MGLRQTPRVVVDVPPGFRPLDPTAIMSRTQMMDAKNRGWTISGSDAHRYDVCVVGEVNGVVEHRHVAGSMVIFVDASGKAAGVP